MFGYERIDVMLSKIDKFLQNVYSRTKAFYALSKSFLAQLFNTMILDFTWRC